MSYFKPRLLNFLPNKRLPVFFWDFVSDIRRSKPNKKFVEDGKKNTDCTNTIQMAYFGSRIWNRSNETRLTINGSINPLWIQLTKNKSGCNSNLNAVIDGIRLCTWPMEVISRAVTNTKTRMSRIRKQAKKPKKTSDPIAHYMKTSSPNEDHDEDQLPNPDEHEDEKENYIDVTLPDFNVLYGQNIAKIYPKERVYKILPNLLAHFLVTW